MRKNLLLLFGLLFWQGNLLAQETFPVNDVQDVRTKAYALTNATIYVDYQTKIDKGTILIRDGKIENVGANLSIPAGYIQVDLAGKFIYPSMIDPFTSYGLPEVERRRGGGFGGREQINSDTKGAYNANEAIKSEYNASDEFSPDSKSGKSLRDIGFGSALTFRADGLARGTGAFVTLGEETANKELLVSVAAANYAFDKGTSSQQYPSSRMGFTAVLRQTRFDAEWYNSLPNKTFTDKSLDAWLTTQRYPQLFEVSNWKEILRADKLGDEFGTQYIIKGNGDEYRRINEIKATNASIILPINFPEAVDVDDPVDALRVSLEDLKHWELAPANPAALEKAGINFALTTDDLRAKNNFWTNLRKAVKYGLSEQGALKAMTFTPANLLRVYDKVGSLAAGKYANFIITNGNIFSDDAIIFENWIQGKPFVLKTDDKDYSANYTLSVNNSSQSLEVSGEAGKNTFKIKVNDSTNISVDAKIDGDLITLLYKPDKDAKGMVRLSGWFSGTPGQQGSGWNGKGQLVNGNWIDWSATFASAASGGNNRKDNSSDDTPSDLGKVVYPFMAYGNETVPVVETLLIKNATVWTNESDGILENTDVLLQNGKIARIGKDLTVAGAKIVDGTGKHLTSGIIDEHSHLANDGINDVVSNSGMVRMKDVIDSEDIGIYRALAGGVTAAQILHGSANPIGGQSGLVKFRWGKSPQEMLIENADEFIKFALGENVKRSTNAQSIRFPQTRMGVEQVYMDAFTAARDYDKQMKAYNALKNKSGVVKPRRDLAMETMAEIINKQRFISCHSYVQSEINMMMKVAGKFNFNVNTFTHILEGYKVADKMAAHGAGGSTFADWWAYKWEVRYAIPYNPALMAGAGVTVAINSDDGEMIRRLNQEAAKSVKYAGMSEEEAWKMVTLNPAKLLHLDNRMGSVKVGKDADVVLWNENPLSIYAKPLKTIVDGVVYFDVEKDMEMRKWIEAERARLIAKMKDAKAGGARTARPFSRPQRDFHCEDFTGYEYLFENK
ncbi:MAG TPA: amidohydrolase family protein [Cyclobacteriaceae bacterium]